MAKRRFKIVVDTNVLLVSISDRSEYHWLYKGIISGDFELALTTEILNEYDEIISKKWHPDVAKDVLRTLLELPNIALIDIFYQLNLIAGDPDDNKFVDCAFSANAQYLVSNDRYLAVLRDIPFPKIPLVTIQEFKKIVKE
ncbi:MAG: putative toxin-antitoxin system toxin component, PIN family [Arcicella sp.]|jgi:putative PIN family toxin of toxin-antitoxin system|nr:putative toxin-antitoxin system toxin component, PIN family [Arcicella sp.]